jgi:hypothetical protein
MLQKARVDGGGKDVKAVGTVAAAAARLHQGGDSFLDWKSHDLISFLFWKECMRTVCYLNHFLK